MRHVQANKILLLVMMTLHIAGIGSAILNTIVALGGPDPLHMRSPVYTESQRVAQLATFAACGLWASSGAIWAPLNAWTLHHRKPWARKSTIPYWAVQLLSCCCFPFGAYGLWAMTRREVIEDLRGDTV